MGAWIGMVGDSAASPELRHCFDQVRAPAGTVDSVMRVHSLRPHTMLGHYALYRSVLHHDANTLPKWFLETVASYVSLLNRCRYSFTNHWHNARALLEDEPRAAAVLAALEADTPAQAFDGAQLALLLYARKLTLEPGAMTAADLQPARAAGVDDGQILEVNQVCAYFNYANRLLNGLGVTLEGDVVGFYQPRDAAAHDWS